MKYYPVLADNQYLIHIRVGKNAYPYIHNTLLISVLQNINF
jgi:hypothetical protein